MSIENIEIGRIAELVEAIKFRYTKENRIEIHAPSFRHDNLTEKAVINMLIQVLCSDNSQYDCRVLSWKDTDGYRFRLASDGLFIGSDQYDAIKRQVIDEFSSV
jgi:hypothetical protein